MERDLGRWEYKLVTDDPFDPYGILRNRYFCPSCGEWQTYGAPKFCPNCGANMFQSEELKLHTYEIGFLVSDLDNGFQIEDETEFDLVEAPFEDMAEELLDLWQVFCDESGFTDAQITYVREVPQEAA